MISYPILLIALISAYPSLNSWGKSPLQGELDAQTEKVLDNTYGFGFFRHPIPLVQRWEEEVARKFFTQNCDKHGPRVRTKDDNCVECKRVQEVGLSNKEFDAIRTYLKGSARAGEYDQWLWLNRAIVLQKEGMSRALPFLKAMSEKMHQVNDGSGSSDLLELDGNFRDVRKFVNQVKSSMVRLAVAESRVSDRKIGTGEREELSKEMDLLIRQTPVLAHSDLHTWVENAAKEGTQASENRSASSVETFVQNYMNGNTLKINKSLESAIKAHEKLLEEKLPQLESVLKDEEKLRKDYQEGKTGAKEKYDIFVSKMLHGGRLLEAVAGTNLELIPGLERAGCELRARLTKLEGFKSAQLLGYSAALGFGTAGVATGAASVFPELSTLSRGAIIAAGNLPSGAIDFSVGLQETAKKCEALGAQLTSGASASGSSQEYMECWQANESAKNMTFGGYALGALASLYQPSLQRGVKGAVDKILKDMNLSKLEGVSSEETKKVTTFLETKLQDLQEDALRKLEKDFRKKDLPGLLKEVQSEGQAQGWSKERIQQTLLARQKEAFEKRAAAVHQQVEKGYSQSVREVSESCNIPAARKTSWADEIGMPWLVAEANGQK